MLERYPDLQMMLIWASFSAFLETIFKDVMDRHMKGAFNMPFIPFFHGPDVDQGMIIILTQHVLQRVNGNLRQKAYLLAR